MNTCMWSWWFPKWDVSKSWDEFQGWRHMITIGLKMVWEPKNCYQGVSGPWIIWSRKNFWKKSLQCCSGPPSWASGSWWPSCTSCKSWRGQIHPKLLISHQFRAHYRNAKVRCKIFLFFINNFSLNTFWNLKPLNQPARQIQTQRDHIGHFQIGWKSTFFLILHYFDSNGHKTMADTQKSIWKYQKVGKMGPRKSWFCAKLRF